MRDEGEFEGVFAAMAKARADARILIVSRLTSGYRIELTKLGREVEASDDVLEAVHGTGGLPYELWCGS